MSPRILPDDEPGLFDDLPLNPERPEPRSSPTPEPGALPLFSDIPDKETSRQQADAALPDDGVTRPLWRPSVPFQAQMTASLLDLGAVLGVGLVVWLGLTLLGIPVNSSTAGYLVLFLVPFSFLYQVFPLAFWGHTPGMARAGLVARGRDGRSLTFSQAGLRWFASVLTLLLVGLPLVVTQTTGRSLADRLSDSETLPAR